jgi:hypothetical protein
MPDEFDFKNYKSMEEFSKSIEGTKYLHDLYLKAVNHPVRREILELINKNFKLSEGELFKKLKDKSVVSDKFVLNYNIDYLLKAFCIEKIEDKGEIYFKITQSGKVIEYLK